MGKKIVQNYNILKRYYNKLITLVTKLHFNS